MDVGNKINSLRKTDEEKRKPTVMEEVVSWVKTIVGTLIAVLLITTFVFRTVEVQGNSMNPTLVHGERIIVWQLFYSPMFSDIIVLEHTDGNLHVKRILGTPGDHVDYIEGQMIVNGELVDEPYIAPEVSTNGFTFENLCQIRNHGEDCRVIPDGYFLVLGDNRNRSGDSREYGLVHESQIMGRVTLRFLPFSAFGIVN
ncbi:MAG: signal peptidase I [Defluviitaleaceae bacterium]|nr:signal peptidase I [Defluviitaleaceae bacterium]